MVVGGDGTCLVVDPAVTRREVEELAASVAALGLRPVAVWSTHPHWDHLLDGDGFRGVPRWAAAAPSAPGWRSQLEAERDADDELRTWLEVRPDERPAEISATAPVPFPSRGAADDAAILDWDGREVLVLTHAAHAPGHTALAIPDAGVLLAGDLLSEIEIPLLDLDAPSPVDDYRSALDAVEALVIAHDLRVLVPGHGTPGHAVELARRLAADRAYLDRLVEAGPEDPRLRDAWLTHAHARQVDAVRR